MTKFITISKNKMFGIVWWTTMYNMEGGGDGQVKDHSEWCYTKKEAIALAEQWQRQEGAEYVIMQVL